MSDCSQGRVLLLNCLLDGEAYAFTGILQFVQSLSPIIVATSFFVFYFTLYIFLGIWVQNNVELAHESIPSCLSFGVSPALRFTAPVFPELIRFPDIGGDTPRARG